MLANLEVRHKLDLIEEKMAQMTDMSVSDLPVRHHFADGMYAREIFLPAGTLVTGKIKKNEHISVVSKGEVYEATEHGAQHIKAGLTFVPQPGTKRLVYAVTDCIWTTMHRTDETDLAKLEDDIIAKTHSDVPNLEYA